IPIVFFDHEVILLCGAWYWRTIRWYNETEGFSYEGTGAGKGAAVTVDATVATRRKMRAEKRILGEISEIINWMSMKIGEERSGTEAE
ncbi:hypothetical protein FRC19_008057, partial [Serendipita sp. 401]